MRLFQCNNCHKSFCKAFRGELVKQLPTDGDASDLLKQIEELNKMSKKQI